MISRVADECFWMGRYLERAESTSRLLSATRWLALDAGLPPSQGWWRTILLVAGEETSFAERFALAAEKDGEQVEHWMTWEQENRGSVLRTVHAARENARSARDLVTLEVWESLNDLHLWLQSREARSEYAVHRFGFYARVCASTQLALGNTQSTMLHDTAFDFIWLGVLLERAGWAARLLDAHGGELEAAAGCEEATGWTAWMALLRAFSGFEPFLRRSRGLVSGRAVASFLLLDTSFPRSVGYAVQAAHARLAAIRPPDQTDLPGGRSLAALGALDAWLRGLSLSAAGTDEYHRDLVRVAAEADSVCEAVTAELLGQPQSSEPPPPIVKADERSLDS